MLVSKLLCSIGDENVVHCLQQVHPNLSVDKIKRVYYQLMDYGSAELPHDVTINTIGSDGKIWTFVVENGDFEQLTIREIMNARLCWKTVISAYTLQEIVSKLMLHMSALLEIEKARYDEEIFEEQKVVSIR